MKENTNTKNTRVIDEQTIIEAIKTIDYLMEGLQGKDIQYALNELLGELDIDYNLK